MPAIRYNFNLEKGGTFRRAIKRLRYDGTPYDFTTGGWYGHMQVRTGYQGSLITDMTTANGGVTFQTTYIILFLDLPTVNGIPVPFTEGATFPSTVYYYDLFVYNDDLKVAQKLLYGKFTVTGGITA